MRTERVEHKQKHWLHFTLTNASSSECITVGKKIAFAKGCDSVRLNLLR